MIDNVRVNQGVKNNISYTYHCRRFPAVQITDPKREEKKKLLPTTTKYTNVVVIQYQSLEKAVCNRRKLCNISSVAKGFTKPYGTFDLDFEKRFHYSIFYQGLKVHL